jgi:hypothetical protein
MPYRRLLLLWCRLLLCRILLILCLRSALVLPCWINLRFLGPCHLLFQWAMYWDLLRLFPWRRRCSCLQCITVMVCRGFLLFLHIAVLVANPFLMAVDVTILPPGRPMRWFRLLVEAAGFVVKIISFLCHL